MTSAPSPARAFVGALARLGPERAHAALDAMLDVPAVGAAPPATRAAVFAAMAGHVRGKAVLAGTFRRQSP